MKFARTTPRVVEGDTGLIIEYRTRQVLMVQISGPVCQNAVAAAMIGSQFGASVWMFERYPAAIELPMTMQTKTRHTVRLISSVLILDAERKLFHLMIRRREWSLLCDRLQ